MLATEPMPTLEDADAPDLKDYLIFRVDEPECHRELSDESALEAEAARYADLRAASEAEPGIHYEVRCAATGGLLYTTGDPGRDRKESPWLQMAML